MKNEEYEKRNATLRVAFFACLQFQKTKRPKNNGCSPAFWFKVDVLGLP
jgi:hypothetical protein